MGIDAYYRRVRYVLGGRADGEERREEKRATIINSIKVIVTIAIRIPPLIALHHI